MLSHRERILDQFTRQAVPFSTAPGIRDPHALEQLVVDSGVGPDDLVLDVACGPGLVVAAFAAVAQQVTGIDLTPAMIARARELTAEYANVRLDVGTVLPLPYADAAFTIVVSRFAFHHLEDPRAVLAEMVRVCRPGGCVLVCDLLASDDPRKAAGFHRMEQLRDPSHVRALTLDELRALFGTVSLPPPQLRQSQLAFELEGLLRRSFPHPGDVERIRAAYRASLEDDGLGLGTRRVGEEMHAAYPVATLWARSGSTARAALG